MSIIFLILIIRCCFLLIFHNFFMHFSCFSRICFPMVFSTLYNCRLFFQRDIRDSIVLTVNSAHKIKATYQSSWGVTQDEIVQFESLWQISHFSLFSILTDIFVTKNWICISHNQGFWCIKRTIGFSQSIWLFKHMFFYEVGLLDLIHFSWLCLWYFLYL